MSDQPTPADLAALALEIANLRAMVRLQEQSIAQLDAERADLVKALGGVIGMTVFDCGNEGPCECSRCFARRTFAKAKGK